MKKIKLTESDLTNIVKRVIEEDMSRISSLKHGVILRNVFDKVEVKYLDDLITAFKEEISKYPNLSSEVVDEIEDRISFYERKKGRIINDIKQDMEIRKKRRLGEIN